MVWYVVTMFRLMTTHFFRFYGICNPITIQVLGGYPMANGADLNQTDLWYSSSRSSLIRVYTFCNSLFQIFIKLSFVVNFPHLNISDYSKFSWCPKNLGKFKYKF